MIDVLSSERHKEATATFSMHNDVWNGETQAL
jgi:hypothetical protein